MRRKNCKSFIAERKMGLYELFDGNFDEFLELIVAKCSLKFCGAISSAKFLVDELKSFTNSKKSWNKDRVQIFHGTSSSYWDESLRNALALRSALDLLLTIF